MTLSNILLYLYISILLRITRKASSVIDGTKYRLPANQYTESERPRTLSSKWDISIKSLTSGLWEPCRKGCQKNVAPEGMEDI